MGISKKPLVWQAAYSTRSLRDARDRNDSSTVVIRDPWLIVKETYAIACAL